MGICLWGGLGDKCRRNRGSGVGEVGGAGGAGWEGVSGSSSPLRQRAVHEWPSFCIILLLKTNTSFLPLRETEECQILQSHNSSTEECKVGQESPVSPREPHQDGCPRKAGAAPGARRCREWKISSGPSSSSRSEQSGQTGCSQSYSVGCSRGNELLGFLHVPNRTAKPTKPAPSHGALAGDLTET